MDPAQGVEDKGRSSPGPRLPEIEGILANRKPREVFLLELFFFQINSGMENSNSLSFIFLFEINTKRNQFWSGAHQLVFLCFLFRIDTKMIQIWSSSPASRGPMDVSPCSSIPRDWMGPGESKTRASLALFLDSQVLDGSRRVEDQGESRPALRL